MGLGRLALIAPEAREARRRAQLVGPGLLRARDLEGALEVRLRVGRRPTGGEDDLAPQPMQRGIRVRLARLRGERETPLDGAARLGEPPGGQVRFADKVRRSGFANGGLACQGTGVR